MKKYSDNYSSKICSESESAAQLAASSGSQLAEALIARATTVREWIDTLPDGRGSNWG
jgi:hypothetical protein